MDPIRFNRPEEMDFLWDKVRSAKFAASKLPKSSDGQLAEEESAQKTTDSSVQSLVLEDNETSSEDEFLAGEDNDPLKPADNDIRLVWNQARVTWCAFVAEAKLLSPDSWPAGSLDPSSLLGAVPSLPEKLPMKMLSGRPIWRVPDIDQDDKLTLGAQKQFIVSRPDPIRCSISPRFETSNGRSTPTGSTSSTDSTLLRLIGYDILLGVYPLGTTSRASGPVCSLHNRLYRAH
jgi:hypothetical protein